MPATACHQRNDVETYSRSRKPSVKRTKQSRTPKAEIEIELCSCQEPRGKSTNEREHQPMEPGEGAHNPERDLDMCRWHKLAPTLEKCRTEPMGCRERVSSQHVEEQELEGHGRSPHVPAIIPSWDTLSTSNPQAFGDTAIVSVNGAIIALSSLWGMMVYDLATMLAL